MAAAGSQSIPPPGSQAGLVYRKTSVESNENTPTLRKQNVDPATLVANPRNARMHSPEQIERLAASLRSFGQPRPVLARAANKMIISGHGVVTAAITVGLPTVAVFFWDVDQQTADRFMLADNRLGDLSVHDDDRVAALLREIDPSNWKATGFSDEEAAQALGSLDDASIAVYEVDAAPVKDRFWISVKGPLQSQAAALDRLKSAMADLPDVAVELGTVDGW